MQCADARDHGTGHFGMLVEGPIAHGKAGHEIDRQRQGNGAADEQHADEYVVENFHCSRVPRAADRVKRT